MLNDIYQMLDPWLCGRPLQSAGTTWYVAGFICAFRACRPFERWRPRGRRRLFRSSSSAWSSALIFGGRFGGVLFYGDGDICNILLKSLAFNKAVWSFHGALVGVLVGGGWSRRKSPISRFHSGLIGRGWRSHGLLAAAPISVNGELWGADRFAPWLWRCGGVCAAPPFAVVRYCSVESSSSACCSPSSRKPAVRAARSSGCF